MAVGKFPIMLPPAIISLFTETLAPVAEEQAITAT